MLKAEWLPDFEVRELSRKKDLPYYYCPKECRQIEATGKKLFSLGVMPIIENRDGSSATHGNLAIRLRHDPSRLIMTATNSDKGMLTPSDFVEVCLTSHNVYAPPGRLPSTDAGLIIDIFSSFPAIFWYAHFHEPVADGCSIRLTYKNLRGNEWVELYDKIFQGIRIFNLLNHVPASPPETPDAAIVLGTLGRKGTKHFSRAITIVKDGWAGKDTSIL